MDHAAESHFRSALKGVSGQMVSNAITIAVIVNVRNIAAADERQHANSVG